MKDISNDPKNYGITFWDKKGDLSRLLEFTGICKAFMRSVQKINKIPLGVLNINSSGWKHFTLQNCWGSNSLPVKKGNLYRNLPHSEISLVTFLILTQWFIRGNII